MENQPQLREVEGRQEIYDNVLQGWRGVTPLDRIKPPQDPDRLFVCPLCGEDVEAVFNITGWETTMVDPETGYDGDLIDGETTDRDHQEYRCSEACGWTADYEWHRAIEREREEAKEKEAKPIPLQVEEIQDAEPTAFHRWVWKNATPDPF